MKTFIRVILAGVLVIIVPVLENHIFASVEVDALRDDVLGTMIRDDFEDCEPKEAMAIDEFREGHWNLRVKTWETTLLCRGDQDISVCPDLTYDPKIKGRYNIYVQTRAMPGVVKFGLRLTSDSDFTELTAPNKDVTPEYHYNVWILWKEKVKMDEQKIIIKDLKRKIGESAYIDAFKFEPIEEP